MTSKLCKKRFARTSCWSYCGSLSAVLPFSHNRIPLAQVGFPAVMPPPGPLPPTPALQGAPSAPPWSEMQVPVLAQSWHCWLTSLSSLPQTVRSHLSCHWNTKTTQQSLKQKLFLPRCRQVWVFCSISKKDALLVHSGSRPSSHQIYYFK